MSSMRRLRRGMARPEPAAPKSQAELNLDAIVSGARDCPGYGGGKWAVYGVGCCWWSSNPSDAGRSPSITRPARFGEGTIEVPGVPCCPNCGSVLMQAPLEKFVAAGKGDPEHYGAGGLATFVAAHAAPCHERWDDYPVEGRP